MGFASCCSVLRCEQGASLRAPLVTFQRFRLTTIVPGYKDTPRERYLQAIRFPRRLAGRHSHKPREGSPRHVFARRPRSGRPPILVAERQWFVSNFWTFFRLGESISE